MTSAVSVIAEKLGGLRPFARAVGKSSASSVQYWLEVGHLPRSQRESVEAALLASGVSPKRARRLVNDAVLGVTAPNRQHPP